MPEEAPPVDGRPGSAGRYIALLRGINVGGHAIVRMADLRKLFESLGLRDISTYIQSGNVLFSAEEACCERLARQLEERLADSVGRQVKVFMLTPADLAIAAANNPFDPERKGDEQRCHLMFLSAEPAQARVEALMAMQGEEYRFHIHGKVLYYAYSRENAGNRRNIDFEKVLGVSGTSRSWKVVSKLIELST